jgi:CRISPR-associated protein Csb2
MLCVTVELLHGTLRAANLHDVAAAGRDSHEWPPSPARLFQAFVAADGTGARRRVTGDDDHLAYLLGTPVIRACDNVEIGVLPARYVVIDDTKGGGVQDYPARQAQEVRPGTRAVPEDPRVAYIWADLAVPEPALQALRLRAARIPYLGCADSPVRVNVLDEVPEWGEELPAWLPDRAGGQVVPVADAGFLARLDAAFEAFSAGQPQRRAWVATAVARYRSPSEPSPEPARPHTIWIRFDRALSGRRIVTLAQRLRAAVLAQLGDGDVSPLVHGHLPPGETGYEHARWLPLPHAGFPHADGRLRGACVWLPPATPREVARRTEEAVRSIRELVSPSGRRIAMQPFDGIKYPWSSNPRRWIGPSRNWVSVTPVVAERYTRGAPALEEIARWCRYAGLPAPTGAAVSRVPFLEGALDLPPEATVRRAGDPVRPYFHLRVQFAEPVQGPVVIGRLRHFGLGLFAPVEETA